MDLRIISKSVLLQSRWKIMTKILLSITKKKHEEVENMMRDTPLSFQTSVAASLGSR